MQKREVKGFFWTGLDWLGLAWKKLIKLHEIAKSHKIPTVQELILKTLDDLIHDEEVLIPEFENEEVVPNPTIE